MTDCTCEYQLLEVVSHVPIVLSPVVLSVGSTFRGNFLQLYLMQARLKPSKASHSFEKKRRKKKEKKKEERINLGKAESGGTKLKLTIRSSQYIQFTYACSSNRSPNQRALRMIYVHTNS